MKKLRELRERRSVLLKNIKALVDKADKESRDFTEDEEGDFNAWDKEADEIKGEIEKLEAREKRIAELAQFEVEQRETEDKEEEKRTKIVPQINTKEERIKVENKRKATEEARNVNTFKLIKGVMSSNPFAIDEARKELAEGGHYDDLLLKENGEKRGFNTLVDEKGGILVPTSISDKIFDIMQDYGIIPRLALNFGNIAESEIKVPEILGRPSFTAVGQGQAISGSSFNLGAIALRALKWGAIINWTNEVSESVAAKLMPILMSKIAEGYAYAQDNAFFNGDGTSAFNGILGLDGMDAASPTTYPHVRRTTAASGNTTFATLDAIDLNAAKYDLAPAVRGGGVYCFHPDFIQYLEQMQDGQGQFIYGKPSELMPVGSLWGRPIATSEAIPVTGTTGTTYGFFFNPGYVAYATGRTLSADRLREGTITDEGSNSVNLATTDQEALRFTGKFDIHTSKVTRTTGGTAKGAFTVLVLA